MSDVQRHGPLMGPRRHVSGRIPVQGYEQAGTKVLTLQSGGVLPAEERIPGEVLPEARQLEAQRHAVLALAGPPNVGKSTVFNLLTGMNQHVGNWPGKTVEQKSGWLNVGDVSVELVDLPGTYSLTANSEEERVTRDEILRLDPDVVLVVANAASLERGLYLVSELLELRRPMVLGVNMMDVAQSEGISVDVAQLEQALGFPVVPLVATHRQGAMELVEKALWLMDHPEAFHPKRPLFSPAHRPVLGQIVRLLEGRLPQRYPLTWVGIKLLEGDAEISALVSDACPEQWDQMQPLLQQHEDAVLDIAGQRYRWIERVEEPAVKRPHAQVMTVTDRLDRVLTHPLWGLLALVAILGVSFAVIYAVATPVSDWFESAVLSPLSTLAAGALAGAPSWVNGLLVHGLLGGVGIVISFLPILVIFFAVMGVLEDTGYLARAAYVMDPYMHALGLHGRSFIPLCLGFGCNVPAVMAARTIDDRRSRLLTNLLTPLVPCTGRLAVVTFLAPALFGASALWVTWGLVAFSILLIAVLGLVISHGVLHQRRGAFIMELPLYHLPNPQTIGTYTWTNLAEFLRKAGTNILAGSLLIWALSYFPTGQVGTSWLAGFGRALAPVGGMMGFFDWRLMVALLTSFIAKENVVSTLGVLVPWQAQGALGPAVAAMLTPASGLAFMVFIMLFVPCLATLTVLRQETGSWRWVLSSIGMQLGASLTFATLIYQVGRLL
jgi:ferrous iron transport protein B